MLHGLRLRRESIRLNPSGPAVGAAVPRTRQLSAATAAADTPTGLGPVSQPEPGVAPPLRGIRGIQWRGARNSRRGGVAARHPPKERSAASPCSRAARSRLRHQLSPPLASPQSPSLLPPQTAAVSPAGLTWAWPRQQQAPPPPAPPCPQARTHAVTLPRDGAREESKVAGAAGSGGGQRRRTEDPAGVGVGPFGPTRAGRGGGGRYPRPTSWRPRRIRRGAR